MVGSDIDLVTFWDFSKICVLDPALGHPEKSFAAKTLLVNKWQYLRNCACVYYHYSFKKTFLEFTRSAHYGKLFLFKGQLLRPGWEWAISSRRPPKEPTIEKSASHHVRLGITKELAEQWWGQTSIW